MFITPGVTWISISLLDSGGGVSVAVTDTVECSDVASLDGIDGGSVVGCVVERVGPVHQGNEWLEDVRYIPFQYSHGLNRLILYELNISGTCTRHKQRHIYVVIQHIIKIVTRLTKVSSLA